MGFCLIYKQKNEKKEETKVNYINFVSEDLTHDSFFEKHVLKNFFLFLFLKIIILKNLHLWCDGGKHFKNRDFLFFLFK